MKDFPQSAHVMPEIVITQAADGLEIHNQLFLPKDLKPGEKRPAIVFVHGGPSRQMLPAYHYMQFYHWAYAYNQWLQSQGYVVMSINYRSGIGYGRSFQRAPNTEGARQLRVSGRGRRREVSAVARRRRSGARRHLGPVVRRSAHGAGARAQLRHLRRRRRSRGRAPLRQLARLDERSRIQSSAAAHIDTWKSPVFLVQGDDDRNVDFSQMVGLVELLRAHGVYYELTVNPGRRARVADPQPLDRHLQPQQRLPASVRLGQADAAGDVVERQAVSMSNAELRP